MEAEGVAGGRGGHGDDGGSDKPCLLAVLATDAIGGAEIQTLALLRGLSARYRLVLLTHDAVARLFEDAGAAGDVEPFADGDPSGEGESKKGRGGDPAWLRIVRFEALGLTNPFDYSRENFLAYARAIATQARIADARVVYAVMHNASLFLSVARWRHFRSLRGRTLVGSLHGSVVGYFAQRGHGANAWERGLIALALRSLHAIATPSRGVGDELIAHFGARPDKVCAIHNGYDLARMRRLADVPAEAGAAAGVGAGAGGDAAVLPDKRAPWVVTCCRLTDQKDFRTLIAAFARLRTPQPAELVIVGEGPQREAIMGWASEYGVAGRLRITGFVANPFAWLRQADVFVLASHYEGFGNVIVEAMTLGVPVVASDCPWGPAEIIEAGRSGELVPPGNADALAAVLNRWMNDPDERARFARAGAKRAEHFNLRRMVAGYETLLARLLAGEPASQAGAEAL